MEEPGQHVSSKCVMEVICDSLRELRETQGVTPARVRQYIEQNYADQPAGKLTERRPRLELRRGLQDGFLVSKGGKYNLSNAISTAKKGRKCVTNTKTPLPRNPEESSISSVESDPTETRGCGCPSKKPKRKSCKPKSKLVCKKVCKRVGGRKRPGLIKRLLKLLKGGRKGGCKKTRAKKKRFSWVRAHCRKNALRKKKSACRRTSRRPSSSSCSSTC